MVTATELNYKNFGRCVKLDNGTASIIITVEVGPRIISYCLNGHENMLLEDVGREFKDDSQELRDYFGEGRTWYIYGGHRLGAFQARCRDVWALALEKPLPCGSDFTAKPTILS